MKVLMIDDEPSIRLLCRVNLALEGWTMLEAENGFNGLEIARAEHPDVILLDVMMPGMSGWQVADALIADEETAVIPFIFLTAMASLSDQLHGYESGGVEYVTKPFNPTGLVTVIKNVAAQTVQDTPAWVNQRLTRVTKLRRMIEHG